MNHICDLFIVKLDRRNNFETDRDFNSKFIICTIANNKKKVIDVFSKVSYKIYSKDKINSSELCCSNPIPLSSVIKYVFTNHEEILNRGLIDEKGLSLIYSHLNETTKEFHDFKTINNTSNNLGSIVGNNYKSESTNKKYKILTNKIFYTEPIIGRTSELKEIMIALATNNKNPILVGPSGVGKSVIVNELAYLIQNNNVPNFLKSKKIIQLNVSDFILNTKYRGELEERFNKIIDTAKEENAILFIDEIHTIIGAGTSEGDRLNVSEMLKPVLDSEDIKVIGTTTNEEYINFFETTALKRRFEKININEPDDILLSSIIRKTFTDYFNNTNISALEIENYLDITIEELIKLTNKKNRTYNDIENNPSLVISIIDKAFAESKLLDNEYLTIDNIIYGINSCNRLYNTSKETTINNLINLTKVKPKSLKKVIELKNHI